MFFVFYTWRAFDFMGWIEWIEFLFSWGRLICLILWGKRLYDLYGIHRYQLLGLCGDQNALPVRWRIHRWPYQHCPAHPTTFASSLVGTILARCARRCASPSRLQSMTVGLIFVYCFFCFLRRHTVAHCVPGLGNCQTTKKTRLRLIPNWNPNGPFFSRPRVEHLFSPSPVDVKWAPMSGTWVPGTWWNPRP